VLLTKDKTKRLTSHQILSHSWLNNKVLMNKLNRQSESSNMISSVISNTKSNSNSEKDDIPYNLNEIKKKVTEVKRQDSIQIQSQASKVEEQFNPNNSDSNFFDKVLNEVKKKNTLKKKPLKKPSDKEDAISFNTNNLCNTPKSKLINDYFKDVDKSKNDKNLNNNNNLKNLENKFKEDLSLIDEKLKLHNSKKESLIIKSKTIYSELNNRITNNNFNTKIEENFKEIINSKFYLEESTDLGSMKPEIFEYNQEEEINNDKITEDFEYLKIIKNLNYENLNTNNYSHIKLNNDKKSKNYDNHKDDIGKSEKKAQMKILNKSNTNVNSNSNIKSSVLHKKSVKNDFDNEIIEIGEVFNEDFHCEGEENILDVLENVSHKKIIKEKTNQIKSQNKGFFDKMFDNLLKPFKCGD
jgi:hypothetical protein